MADMLIPDFRIGKELKEGENRYHFVLAVSRRADDVNANEELREKCGDENTVTYALKEFMDKKLEIDLDCPPESQGLTHKIDTSAVESDEDTTEVSESVAEEAENAEEISDEVSVEDASQDEESAAE